LVVTLLLTVCLFAQDQQPTLTQLAAVKAPIVLTDHSLAPKAAAAQGSKAASKGRDTKRKWEVGVEISGFFNARSKSGTASSVSGGPSYVDPITGMNTQQVSSYFFGPGRALANASFANTSGAIFGQPLPPIGAGIDGLL